MPGRSRRPLRPFRPLAGLAAVAAVVSLAGCGSTADTSAAVVAGRDVDIADVTALASDPVFTGGGAVEEDPSRLPGGLARDVLLFEVERTAWLAELERFGLSISDQDRAAAEAQLAEEAGGQADQFSSRTRELLVEFLAAQQVLGAHLQTLDPDDEDDLRTIHLATPTLWDRACAAIARVPEDSEERVEELIEAGTGVEGLPERLEGAQLAADPSRCLPVAQLPTELRDSVDAARLGRTTAPVAVTDGTGTTTWFVVRVDERRRLGFEEAREEVVGVAETITQPGGARSWVQFQVIGAEIDPRFGAGVGVAGGGQLAITPPPAPRMPVPALGDLVPPDGAVAPGSPGEAPPDPSGEAPPGAPGEAPPGAPGEAPPAGPGA